MASVFTGHLGSRTGRALWVGAFACAVLFGHTAIWKRGINVRTLQWPARYWDDMSVAIRTLLDRRFPAPAPADPQPVKAGGDVPWWVCRTLVRRGVAREGIRPFEFWRTIPLRPFREIKSDLDRVSIDADDDIGRSVLLVYAFQALDGVAPFVYFWLAVFACAPILLWIGWELFAADRSVAATLLLGSLVCSPFVVDSLTLGHSPVGFYLVAAFAVVPLAAYGILQEETSSMGLCARSFVAGVTLALCAVCRSGVVLLLPGFVLALSLSVFGNFCRRRHPRARGNSPGGGKVGLFVGALALLLVPCVLTRSPTTHHHPLWVTLWEGLGDFDRTKGHYWLDSEMFKALKREGGDYPQGGEAFRRVILKEIVEDPAWYAGILAKRLSATVTQRKLWPWGPRDGRSWEPSHSPNEGFIDGFYGLVTTVDHVGLGPWKAELPVSLMVAPTLALLLLWLVSSWSPFFRSLRGRLQGPLAVVACGVAATLPLPVLVTTGGGIETQAFVLVYALGLAFLGDEGAKAFARRGSGGAPRPLCD